MMLAVIRAAHLKREITFSYAIHIARLHTDRQAFLKSTQEARKLLEPGIAALAAAKRTPRQLAQIAEALEGMRNAPTFGKMVEPDVRFHLALLSAANNDLLAPFGMVIEQALGTLFDYTTRHNPKPDFVVPLHEAVYEAIRLRDAAAARRAVARLLEDTDAVVAAREKPVRRK